MTIWKTVSPTKLVAMNPDSTTLQHCKFSMINGILMYNVPSKDNWKQVFFVVRKVGMTLIFCKVIKIFSGYKSILVNCISSLISILSH